MTKPKQDKWIDQQATIPGRLIVTDAACLALAMLAIAISAWWHSPALARDSYPIAGLKPYERPEGAPSISKMTKDEGWYAGALTGVTQPYPRSLRFLEDQEAWFTPFNHPGMTGPYDIRGWHTRQMEGSQ